MTTSVCNALDAPSTKPQWHRDRGNQYEAAGTQHAASRSRPDDDEVEAPRLCCHGRSPTLLLRYAKQPRAELGRSDKGELTEAMMSMLVELPITSYPTQLQTTLSGTGAYGFDTARAMAWIAQLAYETADPSKIDRILAGWKLTRSRLLKSATSGPLPLVDTRGLVLQGWGGTVVAFAGTDPLVPANWLTNFDTLPGPDDIHAGFEGATKAVWPELRSAVLGGDGNKPLYLVGHSLGAALAVIAAKFLHDDRLARVSAVYTFGMPRCGGRRFAADYGGELGSRTYRLVHGDDIVPTVPPSELGFRHVGCLLRCGHNTNFDPLAHPDPAQDDEPSFGAPLLQGIRDLLHAAVNLDLPEATQPGRLGDAYRFLPPAIGDHIPSRYLTALGFKL